ncbi:TIGR03086 family metal-binding protein [Streptomyces tsukubensis]|uniref:TIGR03086 family protein n=1 Tax=Streptomyces tsukubensis TaxID=83656 RepID=A0A1V4A4U4_9ACTN|nr:TIGR03086 family metal-binding protein [Streptomyces tsukubensis]OON74946.1 TIGR03086 family protein [Streptomyces tsukubensis]QFR94738.1 TIGR03086 family protein [Streptomyces tsukubensis]
MFSTRITAVLDDLARVVGATTPEQDSLPTPCAGFDVLRLRRHLLGGIEYFTIVLADPTGDQRPEPHTTYAGSDESAAVEASIKTLAATVRTALADGGGTTPVNVLELGAGTIPADQVGGLLLAETVVHGWDLARATDQAWHPDPAAAEQAYAVLSGAIKPEYRGDGMPFAPEAPVRADAPALERLLAFTGRSTTWTPAVQGDRRRLRSRYPRGW